MFIPVLYMDLKAVGNENFKAEDDILALHFILEKL